MTARMRGNMTVNAGEFSTFLKKLVNTGYIKISTGPGTWEKDIFRATTFVPVSYTHLDVYKRQVQILAVFKNKKAFLFVISLAIFSIAWLLIN